MKLRKRKQKDGSMSYFADWQEGGKRRRHTFKDLDKKLAELAFGKLKLEHAQGRLAIPTQPNLNSRMRKKLPHLLCLWVVE